MGIVSVANNVLRAKSNLLNINFKFDEKLCRAFVPEGQLFVVVKDIFLSREYEYFLEFGLNKFRHGVNAQSY
jgi:hypothetical protein